MPSSDVPKIPLIPHLDKMVHVILFLGFSFLCLAAIRDIQPWQMIFIGIISLVYGWLIEIVQGKLTYLERSFDILDIVADSLGTLIGYLIFYIGYIFTHSKREKTSHDLS